MIVIGTMDYREFVLSLSRKGKTSPLEIAADWWEHLAVVEECRLSWDKTADNETIAARSKMYRRTAEALRIRQRTGIAVCACCHKPLNSGACTYNKRDAR